jgi:hypothetical protein
MVLHGPYVLGGTTYDAISFVAQSSGAYQSSTYDLASGALLSTNSSTKGADSPIHGPLDNPQGNNQLSLTRIAGVRQLSMPGMGAPPPAWVGSTPQLIYSGTYTQANPVDPGAGTWVFPMQSTITFGEIGSTWAAFTSRSVIDVNGYEQPTDGAGVTGSTGLYWYDPATLGAMSPGDLLDEILLAREIDPEGRRTNDDRVAVGVSRRQSERPERVEDPHPRAAIDEEILPEALRHRKAFRVERRERTFKAQAPKVGPLQFLPFASRQPRLHLSEVEAFLHAEMLDHLRHGSFVEMPEIETRAEAADERGVLSRILVIPVHGHVEVRPHLEELRVIGIVCQEELVDLRGPDEDNLD